MLNRAELCDLAARVLPADLVSAVERSFWTPQFGPNHNEGPYMDSHLSLVIETLEKISRGKVRRVVPVVSRHMMVMAVREYGLVTRRIYALLHDVAKQDCMTLVYADGRKVAVTWNEWQAILFDGGESGCASLVGDGDAQTRFCQEQGIEKISYFQKTENGQRAHGRVAAEWLRGRTDIPGLVVRAIETHEIAYQFGGKGGINLPLFEKTFGGWTEAEVGFALAVNYADQMASLDTTGKPVIEDVVWLARTALAARDLATLSARLEATPQLDVARVEKALVALNGSRAAFQTETVEQVYARIVAECRLPEVTEVQIRDALVPVVEAGLSDELTDRIVIEMVANGKLSAETGKALGGFNRLVRPALAKLG